MPTQRLLIFTLTLICLCSGCAGSINKDCPADKQTSTHTVYLVSHGWHVGIVVETSDIPDEVWPIHKTFADAKYLEIGWGDQDFYQAASPGIGIALKTILLPTPSVLHIVAFNDSVTSYFPHSKIISIPLSAPGFQHLIAHIATSLDKDSAGNTVPLGPGLYGISQFYRSRDSYHLFNNCNNWIAKALYSAGCPVSPSLAITEDSLMSQAQSFGTILQNHLPDK